MSIREERHAQRRRGVLNGGGIRQRKRKRSAALGRTYVLELLDADRGLNGNRPPYAKAANDQTVAQIADQ